MLPLYLLQGWSVLDSCQLFLDQVIYFFEILVAGSVRQVPGILAASTARTRQLLQILAVEAEILAAGTACTIPENMKSWTFFVQKSLWQAWNAASVRNSTCRKDSCHNNFGKWTSSRWTTVQAQVVHCLNCWHQYRYSHCTGSTETLETVTSPSPQWSSLCSPPVGLISIQPHKPQEVLISPKRGCHEEHKVYLVLSYDVCSGRSFEWTWPFSST